MITYPDGAILNLYIDGTRTLNDEKGKALDPNTGAPLESGPIPIPPRFGPDYALHLLHGEEELNDVSDANEALKAFTETLEGEIDPASWAQQALESIIQVIKALETEERGCQLRGWCYGVLYGALGMGTPPEPAFSGSLQGPDQDELDRTAWQDGVAAAEQELKQGQDGISLRNKILLRIANDGNQPATTLTTLWHAACESTDDRQLSEAYPSLSWPQPTGA
jgi:hypothetical protein